MSGSSPHSPELEAVPDEAQPPSGSRRGAIVGAVLAAAASAGLAWYLTGPEPTAPPPPKPEVAQVAPKLQLASLNADPAQVERAYEQVQNVYAEQGVAGLARFSEGCGEALAKDPRVLDFCLAFDLFAQAVAPPSGDQAAWFAAGETRRLRLTQAALPAGADPQARIDAVEQLMRRASGTEAARPEPQPTPLPRPTLQRAAAPSPAAKAAARQTLRAAIVRRAAARPAIRRDRCRFESTPADRLLCANPDLKAADQRMRQAYVTALAAGADPEVLDRDQADWRRARTAAQGRDRLAEIYAQRIEDLERAAEPPAPE
jgi:uncharacterized protein YecT (DUF1311 family)